MNKIKEFFEDETGIIILMIIMLSLTLLINLFYLAETNARIDELEQKGIDIAVHVIEGIKV